MGFREWGALVCERDGWVGREGGRVNSSKRSAWCGAWRWIWWCEESRDMVRYQGRLCGLERAGVEAMGMTAGIWRLWS